MINDQFKLAIAAGNAARANYIPAAEVDTVPITAAESIPAYSAVTVGGNVANSANTAHYGKVIGVAEAAINTGFSAAIAVVGLIINSAWSWTPGSSIFLNGTSLSMTPASTGFSQIIGVAKASDTMLVSLSDPILF